ncbi:hypothetical protein WAI453_006447 [Rhynchosporium graminicola]
MFTPVNARTSFMPSTLQLSIEHSRDLEPELPPLLNRKRAPRYKREYKEEDMEKCLLYMDDHPWMTAAEASRVFDLESKVREIQRRRKNPSLRRREFNGPKPLLDKLEIASVKNYIRGQHAAGFSANNEDIESIIRHILSQHTPPKTCSDSFLEKFKKTNLKGIKKRRTKVLDAKRKYAQAPKQIMQWYREYQDYIMSHGITPGRIWNFDESGFRVGMAKGETVYVPEDAADDIYQTHPEKRKQVTVIEGICADGREIPPFVIIEGKYYMEKWFNSKLKGEESVKVSDSGYTSNEIAVDWLKHFIKYAKL